MIEITNITSTGIKKKSERFDFEIRNNSSGEISFAHVHMVGKILKQEPPSEEKESHGIAVLWIEKPIIKYCPIQKIRRVVGVLPQKENIPLPQYTGFIDKLESGTYLQHQEYLYRVVHKGKRIKSNFSKTKAGYSFSRKGACE